MTRFGHFREQEREHILGVAAAASQFFLESIEESGEDSARVAYEGAMFFLGALIADQDGLTASELILIAKEELINYLGRIIEVSEVTGEYE